MGVWASDPPFEAEDCGREYVQRQRPVDLQERVVVGATLPADVEVLEVPDVWSPSVSR